MNHLEECPTCREKFKSVGHHWSHYPDHRPKISDNQMEIATGLLMGDGSISAGDHLPALRANMTNQEYLSWLDSQFPYIGRGVVLQASAEKQAEYAEQSFGENFDTCDIYRWRTSSHQAFTPLLAWYESGNKVWPDDIELTPTVLKHWYCGDGCLKSQNQVTIAMSNELGNEGKVEEYFTSVGLPKPTWESHKSSNRNTWVLIARWSVSESKELLDYMGKPLPGFEYKWYK